MQTFAANEAKTRIGEFIDHSQREPAQVMRHERVVGVVVSAQACEAIGTLCPNRLRSSLRECAAGAALSGLTDKGLAALLADESWPDVAGRVFASRPRHPCDFERRALPKRRARATR